MEAPSLIEEIRFGYGPRRGYEVSPGGLEPDRLLAQLTADDPAAAVWNRPSMADRMTELVQMRDDKMAGMDVKPKARQSSASMDLKKIEQGDAATFFARPAVATLGFVERLVNLWANRITVSNTSQGVGHHTQTFRDEAIRLNIAGRYADMLKATLWHPAMQVYLTQTDSIGPNSRVGLRKGKGLNENLAREFLELHSMGKGYTQTDVTELAKLLAGMVHDQNGPHVEKGRAEPGEKHILGQTYGEGKGQINALVEDVAHRPETAAAVAFFLARHFIADSPPPDLVQGLTATYLAEDTALVPLYRTLLQHPSAADPNRRKIRSPQEFAVASLRLMGLDGMEKGMLGFNKTSMMVPVYLANMGQQPFKPLRPDGWPEVASGWMTPPMVASRIDWATDLARATGDRVDPVALIDFALGDMASPLLRRAVAGAEQRWEGLAVLIASPDFSRR